MRKWLPVVGALALAAVLGVFARLLLEVPAQVAQTRGPGLAARAAGAGDDIRFRSALRLAAEATAGGRNAVRVRSEAESALGRESRSPQAANLLGILSLADAATDPANGRKYMGEAVSAFEGAIRLDPRAEDAKYNLELLLTLRPKAAHATAERPTTSHGKHGRGNRASPPPAMGY
jgi:hypothetical protein